MIVSDRSLAVVFWRSFALLLIRSLVCSSDANEPNVNDDLSSLVGVTFQMACSLE